MSLWANSDLFLVGNWTETEQCWPWIGSWWDGSGKPAIGKSKLNFNLIPVNECRVIHCETEKLYSANKKK